MQAVGIYEWYRPTIRSTLLRPLLTASAILAVGAVLLAFGMTAAPGRLRVLLVTLGGVATAAGPILAVSYLYRALVDDAYLVLRTDGLVLSQCRQLTFLPWDELVAARALSQTQLSLCRKDASALVLTGAYGRDAGVLAQRINHLRCKALLQLPPT